MFHHGQASGGSLSTRPARLRRDGAVGLGLHERLLSQTLIRFSAFLSGTDFTIQGTAAYKREMPI